MIDISKWNDGELMERGWSLEQIQAYRKVNQIQADNEVMAHAEHYMDSNEINFNVNKSKSKLMIALLGLLICGAISYYYFEIGF
tara:strand:+ start:6940 stop:7191 length:252 start_codon:yes stop_codon:yes gene_type:complete